MSHSKLVYLQHVSTVCLSADESHLACGYSDGEVRVFHTADGCEVRSFLGHSAQIRQARFITGHQLLCTASADTTLCVWDVTQGHRLHSFTSHTRSCEACAVSPTRDVVASVGLDCSLLLWNITTGKLQWSQRDVTPLTSVHFHPEGKLVVTGGWDCAVKVWDLVARCRRAVLRGHMSAVRCVEYSPSGAHVVSSSIGGEVKVWSAYTGVECGQLGPATTQGLAVDHVQHSDKHLATGGQDQKVVVWRNQLGSLVDEIGAEEEDEHGHVTCVKMSSSGQWLAVGYHSNHVRKYDLLTGVMLFQVTPHTAPVTSVTVDTSDSVIISSSDDGTCKVLDSTTGTTHISLSSSDATVSVSGILHVSCSAHVLATGNEDFSSSLYSMLNVMSVCGGRITSTLITPQHVLTGHNAPVTSTAFNHSGDKLATASRDGSVRFYGVAVDAGMISCDLLQVMYDCHADWINSCAWSNTNDFLVTCSNDFSVKVWNMENYQLKATLTGHMAGVNSVAYKYGCIISASADGQVKVWSHKGSEITTLHAHKSRVNCCDLMISMKSNKNDEKGDEEAMEWFTLTEKGEEEARVKASERKIDRKTAKKKEKRQSEIQLKTCDVKDLKCVTVSDDGLIKVWHPLDGDRLCTLLGHSDAITSLALSKHGNTLVTAALDGEVKMWRTPVRAAADTGERNGLVHGDEVTAVDVSWPYAVSVSRDGSMALWCVEGEPASVHHIKAHESSANTVSFLGSSARSGCKFISGGNDAQVCTWSVITGKGQRRAHIRSCASVTLASPVISLSCMDNVIAAGLFSGKVAIILSHAAPTVKQYVECFSEWVTSVSLYREDHHNAQDFSLCSLSPRHGILIRHQVKMDKAGDGGEFVYENDATGDVYSTTMLVAQGQEVYNADNRGRMSIVSLRQCQTRIDKKQIHSDAITCLTYASNYLFTASKDKTIKVWHVTGQDLSQVGQLYTPGEVRSVKALTLSEVGKKSLLLMVGDHLGRVQWYMWNY